MLPPVESMTALAQPDADVETAATAMEAFFLRRMLSEVRNTSPGLLDGGVGGRMFRDMLDEALADSMADGGGIGIADLLVEQFGGADQPSAATLLGDLGPEMPQQIGLDQPRRTTARVPVTGRISSQFGRRVDPIHGQPRFHSGVDVAAASGTPVGAMDAGTVTRAGDAGSYGNLVVIDHGGGRETRYAHLRDISVQVGDRVGPGQEIGSVGSTGRSTGPHLHFELRRNGRPIDPAIELPSLKKPVR